MKTRDQGMNILALNGGSSTIKAAFFVEKNGEPQPQRYWHFERQTDGLTVKESHDSRFRNRQHIECMPELAVTNAIEYLSTHLPQPPDIIVHRVVHGGDFFSTAVALDVTALAKLATLSSLAPLHQPFNLALIEACRCEWPTVSSIACFDTAFHQTQTDLQRRYALPRALHDRGIKRYGFHGLSYAHVSNTLFEHEPELREQRVVIAHLGSGASACALHHGVSVASSMGFSALDGLVMGTRCGQLDPGVLLHLLREGMDINALENLLYKQSGLLGLSGISADMRELLVCTAAEAHEAIAVFVQHCCDIIASLASNMQGIDALVFTGGIGEHQAAIRTQIASRLGWLGALLDEDANAESRWQISHADSIIKMFVIPTDEEQEMAKQALAVGEFAVS